MVNKILDQILAETYTQAEALSRLRALKDLILVELFGDTKEIKPSKNTHPNQQTPWIVSLGSSIRQYFTRDNVYQLFEQLEKEIKKIEALTIYLASDMPDEGVTHLGQYVRKNFGKHFLVDLKTDPALVAGCALVWKGNYQDYSIRKRIEENREKILTMMKEEIK